MADKKGMTPEQKRALGVLGAATGIGASIPVASVLLKNKGRLKQILKANPGLSKNIAKSLANAESKASLASMGKKVGAGAGLGFLTGAVGFNEVTASEDNSPVTYKEAMSLYEAFAAQATPEELEAYATEVLESMDKEALDVGSIINTAKPIVKNLATAAKNVVALGGDKLVNVGAKVGENLIGKGLSVAGNAMVNNPGNVLKNVAVVGGTMALDKMFHKKPKPQEQPQQQPIQQYAEEMEMGNLYKEAYEQFLENKENMTEDELEAYAQEILASIEVPDEDSDKTASEILDEMYEEKVAKFKLYGSQPGLTPEKKQKYIDLGARIDKGEKLTSEENAEFNNLAENYPTKVLRPHFEKADTAKDNADAKPKYKFGDLFAKRSELREKMPDLPSKQEVGKSVLKKMGLGAAIGAGAGATASIARQLAQKKVDPNAVMQVTKGLESIKKINPKAVGKAALLSANLGQFVGATAGSIGVNNKDRKVIKDYYKDDPKAAKKAIHWGPKVADKYIARQEWDKAHGKTASEELDAMYEEKMASEEKKKNKSVC